MAWPMVSPLVAPFVEDADGTTSLRWEKWREHFDAYLAWKDVEDHEEKFKSLMLFGGPDVRKIISKIQTDEEHILGNRYRAAVQLLDEYFVPRVSKTYERQKFRQMLPSPSEKLDTFVIRLKKQASYCNFGDQTDSVIVDQVIATTKNQQLRRKCLEKDHTLDQLLAVGRTLESVDHQLATWEIEATPKPDPTKLRTDTCDESILKINTQKYQPRIKNQHRPRCTRCDSRHQSNDPACPAKSEKCRSCGVVGHFARCCFLKKKNTGPIQAPQMIKKKRFVREVHEQVADPKESEAFDLFHLGGKRTVKISVGGVPLTFVIDTGADEDILSYTDWQILKRVGFEAYEVKKGSNKIFNSYGSTKPLTVLGEVQTDVQFNETIVNTKFYVIRDGKCSLLSGNTAVKLGLVKFLYEINNEAFPCMKGIEVCIKIDETVPPVRQSLRRIPYPLEEQTLKKLSELEKHDIIERVNEASEWVSPMLIKRKSSGEVRIIVDLREANKAVIREMHPLPTLEQMSRKIGGNKIFTKLDIKQAFHQVMLKEECRYITTFISPIGLMRYKRLMFGLSAAPELFQKVMDMIFADFPWLIVFIDDVLIPAKDDEELMSRTKLVYERLRQYNVLLNLDKVESGVKETDFLGYHISEHGISVSRTKLEAIAKMERPKSAEELRSFLGLINFVHRYIPHLSTITYSLNLLTRKGTPFIWESEHQEKFNQLKQILLRDEILGYYNPNDETFVIADGSPVGLGAVLVQRGTSGEDRIICFASKTLTATEQRYAQTEREALALVWACEKFHYYLYGKFFWLVTDHKPLVAIFGERVKPSPRIERWKLRLMAYDYKVMYRPGKSNIADPLSRLCQSAPEQGNSFDEESERIIRAVADSSCPVSISVDQIVAATKTDIELQEIIKWLPFHPRRWPKSLNRYKKIADSLTSDGDLVMKDQRIVIPRFLQTQILQLAHNPHLGISSMKRRLRTKVWWTRMDQMVDDFVHNCTECILVSAPDTEPISRIEIPNGPWKKVAVDFTEVVNGIHLLVITDYFSRYLETVIVSSMTAKNTITKLREVFARFGYPEHLVCDNGQPFSSEEFSEFCRTNGITICHTVPYAPFQNGLVERQNRTLLKTIKISVTMGRDWKTDLQDFLHAYRATPHAVTNYSPSELMFGWNIRDRLPGNRRKVNISQAMDNDKTSKEKGRDYTNKKRRAKMSNIDVGDIVVIKNMIKKNKLTPTFSPQKYEVVQREGTRLHLRNMDSGVICNRHVNHAKKLFCFNPLLQQNAEFQQSGALDEIPKSSQYEENLQETRRKRPIDKVVPSARKLTNRIKRKPEYLDDYELYTLKSN